MGAIKPKHGILWVEGSPPRSVDIDLGAALNVGSDKLPLTLIAFD